MNANAAPFTSQEQSVQEVANQVLPNFDQDLLGYIVVVVEEMTLDERQSRNVMMEAVAPFILDSEYVSSEKEAEKLCKRLIVAFGGSGFKGGKAVADSGEEGSAPGLLTTPVRIKEMGSHLLEIKKTYGGVVLANLEGDVVSSGSNSALDMSSMPTTTRQRKRAKKEQELLQRKLRAMAVRDAEERRAMAAARMAAIRVHRVSGNKAKSGYSLDHFSVPHPSGTGNLLEDVTLSLASHRRYGLIGKNGSGKTSLMKALANYTLPGLSHLKILLVEQHVEGDEDSPLQWLPRADVERTTLLADEAHINAVMYAREAARSDDDSGSATAMDVPADLVEEFEGVNLEAALEECYERMGVIGVATAEQRALQILRGLGFTDEMAQQPTSSLSGGWAMRAALASALFVKPDLLLLDEPTNHLDVHALVWLEQWLLHHCDGIALIVSHDHFFLDAVCTNILELKSALGGRSKSSLENFSSGSVMSTHFSFASMLTFLCFLVQMQATMRLMWPLWRSRRPARRD